MSTEAYEFYRLFDICEDEIKALDCAIIAATVVLASEPHGNYEVIGPRNVLWYQLRRDGSAKYWEDIRDELFNYRRILEHKTT